MAICQASRSLSRNRFLPMLRLAVSVIVFSVDVCLAGQWPAFRGDPDHTGVADQALPLPLRLAWTCQPTHPPQPAFRGGLAPSQDRVESITYDYVFEPVVGDGRIYFGSSSEDTVFCLDCATGERLWAFPTAGPVRFAPRLAADRLFFGSDDGWVYCLDAASGSLIWSLRAAPSEQRCIGNGRLISAWPVRTSTALAEDCVYFAAGLFPATGAYLCAADAQTGQLRWRRRIPYSPHGELLVEGERLVVATGRTAPAEFRRSDGQPLGEVPSPRRALGGSFVGKLNDMLVWGPDESGVMFLRVSAEPIAERRLQDAGTTVEGRVTGLQAHSVVGRERLYLVRREQVLAVDWQLFHRAALENPQVKWRRWEKASYPRYGAQPFGLGRAGQLNAEDVVLFAELERAKAWSAANENRWTTAILVGGLLVLGGKDHVAVLDAETGNPLDTIDVQGEARGLAVSDGSLLVSTDRGILYCFRHDVSGTPRINRPEVEDARSTRQQIQAAAMLLGQADTRRGFCLVLGAGDPDLVAELARQSAFCVIVVDPDASHVAAARDRLVRAGLYGKRVVVQHVAREQLACPAYFANLIVSDEILQCDRLPYPSSSVLRLLQPYGGTIVLRSVDHAVPSTDWRPEGLSAWTPLRDDSTGTWQVARRGELPGAGQWTHMYADAANTVCSNDRLVGCEFGLHWFGPPGAEDVVERHAIAMPPLFKEGRLFLAGLFDTVQAVDAYNGTPLWKTTVSESTRMMLSHAAGFMAAGDDGLFVAADSDCWMLDVQTGRVLHKFAPVHSENDWGYVGAVGNYLLGSDQKTPADQYSSGARKEGYRFLTSAKDLHSRPTVSETLFAFDCRTRERVWTCAGPAAILNSTITVGGDRVYFVESRAPNVLADQTGTAWLPDFFAQDARLVAIDLADGRPAWSQPLGPLSAAPGDTHEHIAFLSYSDGLLLLTRTGHIDGKLSYRLEGRTADTGAVQWQQTIGSRHRVYAPLTYGKNGQQSHPSIVAGRVFLLSHITDALIIIDLKTGAIERDDALFDFWIHSKTCAVPTASASGLFFRRDSCYLLDLPTRRAIGLTSVTRPGCWMSIIPAGGLILMPEASSGCTCGFALQTSVVLAPAD
jgi:outer membrane protein assembly factor BamB